MNARQARSQRAAGARKPAGRKSSEGTKGSVAEVDNQQPMEFPCVMVVRIPGETPGSYNVQVMPMNGLDTMAIPTLLEYAIAIHKKQIGLPG